MIAKVLIDSPLPHLDRPFDYLIPDALEALSVGTSVRVPFSGRLVNGIVIAITSHSDASGLKSVKSAGEVPTFSPQGLDLAASVPRRYGGATWDMLRLMAPPRVASVERLSEDRWAPQGPPKGEDVVGDQAFPERALWAPLPRSGELLPAASVVDWAVQRSARGGSVIMVMPDKRHVSAVMAAASTRGLVRWTPRKGGDIAVLDADDGPSLRYASHLAAMRGTVSLVLGTRAASWQDVPLLAGIAIWDEGAAAYAEPRAPYPHARTVAAMRAQDSGCALLVAGRVLSADAMALASHGFLEEVSESTRRDVVPAVQVIDSQRRQEEGGSGKHWLPQAVLGPLLHAAHTGIAAIVVPQAGYGAGLACGRCGEVATCAQCGGDVLRRSPSTTPYCADCETEHPAWHCASCTSPRLVPMGLGVERAAQQLRLAAPGVDVVVSAAATGTLADGEVQRGLVVATPGALPAVDGGYGHVAVVNAHVAMGEGLGAEVAAARRWVHAGALAKGRSAGGTFSLVGDLPSWLHDAIVTWDGFAAGRHDLEERVAATMPPHRRAAWVGGDPDALSQARLAALECGDVEVLPHQAGSWILTSRSLMQGVVDALRAVAVDRSGKGASPLTLRVDAPIRAGAPASWARR